MYMFKLMLSIYYVPVDNVIYLYMKILWDAVKNSIIILAL
jgi:hypothetical protein